MFHIFEFQGKRFEYSNNIRAQKLSNLNPNIQDSRKKIRIRIESEYIRSPLTLWRFVSSSTGEQAADNGDNDPLRPGAGGGRKSPVLVRSVGAHYGDTPAIIATNPAWTMDSIYTRARECSCRNRTEWKSKTEVLLLLHLFPFESCWNKNKDCRKEFFHSPLKRSDPDHLCIMHTKTNVMSVMSVTNWASDRCSFDSARLDNVLCRECKSIH